VLASFAAVHARQRHGEKGRGNHSRRGAASRPGQGGGESASALSSAPTRDDSTARHDGRDGEASSQPSARNGASRSDTTGSGFKGRGGGYKGRGKGGRGGSSKGRGSRAGAGFASDAATAGSS